MKTYCGAVFFDIDGTLVDEREKIYTPTEKTRQALESLKARGYLIGIATGRARCYMPDLGIDFDCYIGCNGATCHIGDQEISNAYFQEEDVRDLMRFLEKEGMGYDLETTEVCYVYPPAIPSFQELMEVFHIAASDCFHPLEDKTSLKVNKMLVTFDREEQFERAKKFCQGRFALLRHHQNRSADVSRPGMNKAVGIRAATEYLGISPEKVYAFGDDSNDYEMLKEAAYGIAMTPHAIELSEVADFITGSVAEDGILQGLRHYGLID